jgi:predicted TIM-barrel fold metal-dependent hydrolase
MAISRKPSSFLGDGRLFVSTEGEDGLGHVVEQIGSGWLVWASDYPHWDATFPGSVAAVAERNDLAEADRAAILSDNPARLYGWT